MGHDHEIPTWADYDAAVSSQAGSFAAGPPMGSFDVMVMDIVRGHAPDATFARAAYVMGEGRMWPVFWVTNGSGVDAAALAEEVCQVTEVRPILLVDGAPASLATLSEPGRAVALEIVDDQPL